MKKAKHNLKEDTKALSINGDPHASKTTCHEESGGGRQKQSISQCVGCSNTHLCFRRQANQARQDDVVTSVIRRFRAPSEVSWSLSKICCIPCLQRVSRPGHGPARVAAHRAIHVAACACPAWNYSTALFTQKNHARRSPSTAHYCSFTLFIVCTKHTRVVSLSRRGLAHSNVAHLHGVLEIEVRISAGIVHREHLAAVY